MPPPPGSLSPDQLSFLDTNGYLVLEEFSSAEEVQAMRDRMSQLVAGFDGVSTTVFSGDKKQVMDDYFLNSAENISFFYEEKAFGDDVCLKQPKELSINKVGHGQYVNALHELDPVFKKFSFSESISSLFSSLGYRRPAIIQSMYIFKQPHIGGEVLPHQDSTFINTEPPSLMGLWLALEEATINNGCLWALPRSHKHGLVRRMIRDENGTYYFDRPSLSYDHDEFVPLEVKPGTLLVLHGDIIHKSFANLSPTSRHALTYMQLTQKDVNGPTKTGYRGKLPLNRFMYRNQYTNKIKGADAPEAITNAIK